MAILDLPYPNGGKQAMIEFAAGAQQEALPLREPRRLWSLWQIMQVFRPEHFVQIAKSLGVVQHSHIIAKGDQKHDKDFRDRDIEGFKSYIEMFEELNFMMCKFHVD